MNKKGGMLDSLVRFVLLVIAFFVFAFLYTTQQLQTFIHFVVTFFQSIMATVDRLL